MTFAAESGAFIILNFAVLIERLVCQVAKRLSYLGIGGGWGGGFGYSLDPPGLPGAKMRKWLHAKLKLKVDFDKQLS